MINNLVILLFLKSTLKTLKCIFDILENIANGTKFLTKLNNIYLVLRKQAAISKPFVNI